MSTKAFIASGFMPHPFVSDNWSCIVTGKSRSVRAPFYYMLYHRLYHVFVVFFFQFELLLKNEYSNNFTRTICHSVVT